jgi:predicted SAM-dependent methyltransferase
LRSICFLEQGAVFGACEAAKEELRYFPDHSEAAAMLASLLRQLFPGKPKLGGPEFHELYRVVRPYTMLSDERLYSLYLRTRLVCQMDVPGDLVECGVAAGGGSAMIAATMARHTKRPRKLYSCDTFDGMPVPTDKDVAYGVSAEASGWGSGTCAAPPGSLLEVCEKLGVGAHVVPVKGFFKDTLPGLKDRLPDGIAFLHMDGDWYESTMDILVSLYGKVQSRGFIQVDDYGHWEGCRQAMWDFAKPKGFEFNVHIIDGTGVWLQRPDRQASDLMLLNLGCGGHYHRDWVNIDIAPATKDVIYHDLANEPLPFEDGSCAAVYHSHVLEHIPPAAVPAFIRECYRVLAPGGVIRIAVPDLEGLAREYLRQLESGDAEKHEWMIIELIDQLARNHSGGRMMEYWKQDPMPAEEFVFQRSGREAQQFVEQWRANPVASAPPSHDPTDIGRFRLSGEVHQWMYDRVSLSRLLLNEGFTNPRVSGAQESGILDFASYELDANAAGQVRKPDSLFMEATRPH